MTSIQTLQTDILVLGSGGAGLFAALHAHQANPDLHITIAVKGLLGKCGCTRMVQGGYNVALAEGDSVERHFMDTIEGGKWLSDQELAWTLVNKSVERIRELENELDASLIATQMGPFIKRHLQDKPLIAPYTRVTSPGLRLLIA